MSRWADETNYSYVETINNLLAIDPVFFLGNYFQRDVVVAAQRGEKKQGRVSATVSPITTAVHAWNRMNG